MIFEDREYLFRFLSLRTKNFLMKLKLGGDLGNEILRRVVVAAAVVVVAAAVVVVAAAALIYIFYLSPKLIF